MLSFSYIYTMLKSIKYKNKRIKVLWIKPKDLDQYWNLVHFMIAEGLNFDGNPMDVG